MSFLTSRIPSTLSPPRQRESTTSFRPLARGRWRLSTLFCCILCGKSWFSTIGQQNFVGDFPNFVGRFQNFVGRFSNSVGHFSNFIGRFQNFVGRFSNSVGRFFGLSRKHAQNVHNDNDNPWAERSAICSRSRVVVPLHVKIAP